MPATGPSGKGWISVRPPMDGPSKARMLMGTVAVVIAALASLALLNVLLEEPLPQDTGDGGGGSFNFEPTPQEPEQQEQPQQQPGQNSNPCDRFEPPAKTASLVSAVISMGLWVIAVWWRQKRQTRVLNGFAIAALLVTLVSVTLMFAWWIIHKVCSLDVFDLKNCLDIAHSLRDIFFLFLVFAIGLLGWAFFRFRKGQPFWSLYSIGGFVFIYLMVLGLVGWQVAEDMCERQFKQPDLNQFEPDGPDGPDGNTPDNPDGSDPDGGNQNSGGSPGLGRGGNRGGGGGAAGPALPQVSPFVLLVVLGIAALVTVLVLAVKGRQDAVRAAAMAAMDMRGRGGMLKLFNDTDLESNDAVVATYRKFLDEAMLMGVEKKPNETPMEHARRAAPAMQLEMDELEPLVTAYLHIRLADKPLQKERRSLAIGIARLFRPRPATKRGRR